mmetsp:Transcript_84174/g.136431  ORF Transcript_84174/g.136431 Transcript_84174/m.136431 type:complete len:518 (-) Transcript_84174:175-1728(-)
MLPMISARGNGNMSAHAGGQDTARSRGGDANKFNKLKGVLVNNLLKYYHKETKRQGNEQVYARAVEEVERILQHGKLQEKHLKELQQRFASGLGISEGKVGQTSKGALTMHSNMGPAQIISDDGAIERHNAAGGTAEEDASTMDGMSTANGSPSKRQRKVDEWSVMTLYNDVRHYEEQKQLKDKKLQEKAKTRDELLEQMNLRQRLKDDQRASERRAADDQKKRYDAWQQEKDVLQQRKLVKMAEDRSKAAQVRASVENNKRNAADVRLKEEQRTLDAFHEQMEKDKRDKLRQMGEKKQQYEAVLLENAKDLDRKRMIKEKEKEEDARLFQVQLEMAEKQEKQRAAREEARQGRLKAAEKMAEVQGSNAAELDRQVEERVKRAQEDLRSRELEREKNKRDKKKKATTETMGVLQEQIAFREVEREKAKASERARALVLQTEAEAFQKEQHMQKVAKKERQNQNRKNLDQQRAMKDMQQQHNAGMSEVELRINASILKKVVSDQPDLPEDLAAKLALN